MRKTFMGVRLRALREERRMTQAALAEALGLSTSYLSQLEKNQRPLTVPVLLKINSVFGIDVQLFSDNDEARLISDLRDALSEAQPGEAVPLAEIRELAAGMPAIGQALVNLHRRYRSEAERADAMATRLGDERPESQSTPMPFEQVRDFFYARHNHVAELDDAAERLYETAGLSVGNFNAGLIDYMSRRHGVRIARDSGDEPSGIQRRYDKAARVLHLSAHLRPGQHAFQMATQLAFLEVDELLRRLVDEAAFEGSEARALARIGLANYFAGALLLPYGPFLQAAETVRYDIERLGRWFGVGYETICHRLSTLQRPSARGVPFFFVRVDRADGRCKVLSRWQIVS